MRIGVTELSHREEKFYFAIMKIAFVAILGSRRSKSRVWTHQVKAGHAYFKFSALKKPASGSDNDADWPTLLISSIVPESDH